MWAKPIWVIVRLIFFLNYVYYCSMWTPRKTVFVVLVSRFPNWKLDTDWWILLNFWSHSRELACDTFVCKNVSYWPRYIEARVDPCTAAHFPLSETRRSLIREHYWSCSSSESFYFQHVNILYFVALSIKNIFWARRRRGIAKKCSCWNFRFSSFKWNR